MTISTTGGPDLDTVLCEAEIGRLLLRYATALDFRDWDLLATCFVPEARVTYVDTPELVGRDAVIAHCRTALERYAVTQHAITNPVVDLAPDRTSATARCYVRAEHVHAKDDRWQRWTLGGRYEDRLLRTDEGWRITERRLLRAWTATTETPAPPAG